MFIHLLPFGCHFSFPCCKLGDADGAERNLSLQSPSAHFIFVGLETRVVKSTFPSPERVS